jgi:RNA polymerase sigma-70 factor (ECF subfamily)
VYQGGLVVPADRLEPFDATFELLSERGLNRCYSLAGYLLGDAAEAEDAAQEAMARAWTSRRTLRDTAAFDGWLDRILVNTCIDRMRRRRLVRFVDIEAGEEVPAADPFRRLLAQDEIGRALDVLSPEQRAVVVLRFWRDLSLEQIAARLGCPTGTVKSRLHTAIAAMRDRMNRDAGGNKR